MSNRKYELYVEMLEKEQEYYNRDKVIEYFIDKCKQNRHDHDLFNYLNELFELRGYGIRFKMPLYDTVKSFDYDEYKIITSGVGKSKSKTIDFINYLHDVGSRRLFITSMYLIKMKYLEEIGIVSSDNLYIKDCIDKNKNLQEALFDEYKSEDIVVKEAINYIKQEVLGKIVSAGFDDYEYYYWWNEFVLDSEYLLYSIGDYKIANTIKIIFKMLEKDFIGIYKEKKYYPKVEKAATYINKIDYNLVKEYLIKYKDVVSQLIDDGYVLFYRNLESRRK